jgi:hypothetical protein
VSDAPLDETWSSDYMKGVFCEIPEDLLGTCCSLTRSYLPFDLYEFTQIEKTYEIYMMVSNFLLLEFQLARVPENYFLEDVKFWSESHQLLNGAEYTAEAFKADLIETLHFITRKMVECVANKKCLIIAGI